jgi:hypothetical protein
MAVLQASLTEDQINEAARVLARVGSLCFVAVFSVLSTNHSLC